MKDLTGNRFGRLVAIEPTSERIRKSIVWKCKCDCGNYVFVCVDDLRKTKSCGCLRSEHASSNAIEMGKLNAKNISEHRFGSLVAIESIRNKNNEILWKCKCDCGKITFVRVRDLTSGHTTSCGCNRTEIGFRIKTNKDHIVDKSTITRSKDILSGKLQNNNTSGVTGVYYRKSEHLWEARIHVDSKIYRLGRFSKFEDAVKARKSAEWMVEERIENLQEGW